MRIFIKRLFIVILSVCIIASPFTATSQASEKIAVKVTKVTLSEKSLTITAGKTAQLHATVYPKGADQKVTWSSSDDVVLKVTEGELTGEAPGTATITVKTTNGKTAKCKVTVKEDPNAPYQMGKNIKKVNAFDLVSYDNKDISGSEVMEAMKKYMESRMVLLVNTKKWTVLESIEGGYSGYSDEGYEGDITYMGYDNCSDLYEVMLENGERYHFVNYGWTITGNVTENDGYYHAIDSREGETWISTTDLEMYEEADMYVNLNNTFHAMLIKDENDKVFGIAFYEK